MSSFLGTVSTSKAVVVGIDFGTSTSGIAIGYKDSPTVIHAAAPTASNEVEVKVPTSLLKVSKSTGDEWFFGNTAETKYYEYLADSGDGSHQLYKCFKMSMKNDQSDMDMLVSYSKDGVAHPLLDLVTKSLEFLKDFAFNKIQTEYPETVNADNIHWMLTVPAIWSDNQKEFMRRAACGAGIISDIDSENLTIVLEPESACIAVNTGFQYVKASGRFIVLDCGGGTVDITTHEVKSINPLSLESCTLPCGGPWGSMHIDLEFTKFLEEFLGSHYDEEKKPFEFYNLFLEFERIKTAFDGVNEPLRLDLSDVVDKKILPDLVTTYNNKHPAIPVILKGTRGHVALSSTLMLSFYEPFLSQIVTAVQIILSQVSGISHIILVGGFGGSDIVFNRITSTFQQRGIACLRPFTPRPQAAIVHGAVYCGLFKNIFKHHTISKSSSSQVNSSSSAAGSAAATTSTTPRESDKVMVS
jgi:molecular chaperone DnaK (HSP70)